MDSSVNAQTHAPKRGFRWRFWLGWAVLAVIGIVYMSGRMRPDNLGVQDGRFSACPDSPNCVSTQGEGDQGIEPLKLKVDPVERFGMVAKLVTGMPRTKLVSQTQNYLHAECTSLLFRYVDDLEVWIDGDNGLLHARSASRVGYSDLGVNRHRVEQLFAKLIDAGLAGR